jgi:uncharacterized protein
MLKLNQYSSKGDVKIDLEIKLNYLKKIIQGKKVIVAFSGGSDSLLILKTAIEYAEDVLAVTIDNGMASPGSIESAERLAKELGCSHKIIHIDSLEEDEIRFNKAERCFFCKEMMYDHLLKIKEDLSFDFVADGTNVSDILDDRPGLKVLNQKEIKTPLLDAGFTYQDVRDSLKLLGINPPASTTCLATRISQNCEITNEKMKRVAQAEEIIKSLTSVQVVRVRDRDNLAIIEVDLVEELLDIEILQLIKDKLSLLGFNKVTLDLEKYKSPGEDTIRYEYISPSNDLKMHIKLPYSIELKNTLKELNKLDNYKSKVNGNKIIIKGEIFICISCSGNIEITKLKSKEQGEEIMCKILPFIRRT